MAKKCPNVGIYRLKFVIAYKMYMVGPLKLLPGPFFFFFHGYCLKFIQNCSPDAFYNTFIVIAADPAAIISKFGFTGIC